MKRRVLYKICNIILFAVSILLAWGGMIYATKNPDQVRIIGLLISFLAMVSFSQRCFNMKTAKRTRHNIGRKICIILIANHLSV